MPSSPSVFKSARHGLRLLAVLLLLAAGLDAQETTATLSGTVKDTTGAVLPGATVTSVQVQTGVARTTTTNASGLFFFNNLPVGSYNVAVELLGFKKYQAQALRLHVNDKTSLAVTLELGGITEEIKVEADAARLQTESAEVSNLVGADQMQDLPLNGRDFNQLVDLVPGINPDNGKVGGGVGLDSDTSISINGNQSNSNLFLIDGEYNMDSGANLNLLVTPSVDAIEEFKILRNNYSAEFGGATGGVVNVVTKSGGQQIHGSLYEFMRNDRLDATDPFLKAAGEKKSKLTLNNYGATLSGPLSIPGLFNTDRTSDFFFLSYEGTREARGHVSTSTVPTLRQRQGILDPNCEHSDPGTCTPQPADPQEQLLSQSNVNPGDIDPNTQAFLDRYPLPNASFEDHGYNWINSTDTKTRNDQLMARWDHYFGSKAILTLRYIYMKQAMDGITDQMWGISDSFPTVNRDWSWKGQNAIAKLSWNLTPRLLNDFQFGYSSNALGYDTGKSSDARLASREGFTYTELFPETSSSFPTLNGMDGFGGLGNGVPFNNRTDNFQIKDDITYSFGSHNLKLGAFYRLNKKREPANGGTNQTAGIFTFSSFENFLRGDVETYLEEQTQNDVYDNSRDFAFYVHDTWKLRNDLTLDLGLRVQNLYQIYSAKDNIGNFDPAHYDPSRCSGLDENGLVDPRICDPSNGMVNPTTSGVGRSTVNEDGWKLEPRLGFAWRPGRTDKFVVRGGWGIYHGRDAASQTSVLGMYPPFDRVATLNGITYSQLAPGQLSPYDLNNPQPTLGLYALDKNYKSPQSQQFSFGFQAELPLDFTAEINYVGARGKYLGRNRDINQVPDAYRLEVAEGAIENADTVRPYLGYNILNLNERVGESTYNSLQVALNRRMKSGFEFHVAYTYARSRSNTANQDTEWGGFPIQDSSNPGAEWAPSNQDVTHSLVFSYIWELPFFKNSKGFTKAVLGGWQIVGITMFRSGLPATVCLDQDVAGSGNQGWYSCQRPNLVGDPNLPRDQRTVDHWFNTAAFQEPAPGTFGNSPRNNVRMPGINNWDFSVFKNFELPWFGGSLAANKATLQFRADFFNVFNHVQYGSADSGFVVGGGESGFGHITSARSPREIQLALKLMW